MKALHFFAHRNLRIVGCVLLLHVLAVWALQSGLLQRTVESVVAVQLITEVVEAPSVAPQPAAATPAHPSAPSHAQTAVPPVQSPLQPPLQPQAPQATEPSQMLATAAPVLSSVQAMAAPVAPAATGTAGTAGTAPASARVELPSSEADYLHNPKAPYPLLSQRRNEQGRVVVEVLIGIDGTAQRAQIKESSGFARLDQQALNTVLSWRYVPGKRGGVPQAMTYSVPINFVLE